MGSWEWGGLRGAVGAGLPTRNDQNVLYFLANIGEQGKAVYPAHPFLQGNTTLFSHFWWAALLLRLPSVPPFPTSHFAVPPWISIFCIVYLMVAETSNFQLPTFRFPLSIPHFALCSMHVPLYVLMGGT